MPKLTKADVARHLKISRQTLYEWISKGRISVGPDGLIDSAEVARVSGSVTQPDVNFLDTTGQVVTSPKGDTTRELIDVLKAQLAEAQVRERFLQEQVDRLTSIIDRRLLEAPRSTTPTTEQWHQVDELARQRQHPGTAADALPEAWQRILGYMQEQPRPMSPREVEQALSLQGSPRHAMKRMCDVGLLRRVGPGQYVRGEGE